MVEEWESVTKELGDAIRLVQEAVKSLVQKRIIIADEESLKPQENATKKGEVKESN